MRESFEWKALTPSVFSDARETQILVVRGDGRGYYGKLISVNQNYVELANGDQKQLIYFNGPPALYAVVKGPSPRTWETADKRLSL